MQIIPEIYFIFDEKELKFENLRSSSDLSREILHYDGILRSDFFKDAAIKIVASAGRVDLIVE